MKLLHIKYFVRLHNSLNVTFSFTYSLTKQLISLKTNDDVKANERIAETTKLMSTSIVTFIKKTMFHSPLRRPEFTLLCIANLFGDFTQYLPYIYLPDMMGLVGISLSDASFTIALMGFSNLIGRIASGVVLDTSYINSFAFICISFLSSGKYNNRLNFLKFNLMIMKS